MRMSLVIQGTNGDSSSILAASLRKGDRIYTVCVCVGGGRTGIAALEGS